MAYVLIADTGNHRIVKRFAGDLSYVTKIGSIGAGNDQFSSPRGIATDGTYVYVCDNGNNRIVKRLALDLSYDSQAAVAAYAVACDGTNLYCLITATNKIAKYDLTMTATGVESTAYTSLSFGVGEYGNFVYASRTDGATAHGVYKLNKSDLTEAASNITARSTDADKFHSPWQIACDGTYVYVAESGANRVKVLNVSDLSYVTNITGAGADTFDAPRGVATDGAHLWITSWDDDLMQKREVDGDFVSTVGASGSGDDQFDLPHSVAYLPGLLFGQIQVAGVWKDIDAAQIQVGGVWKDVEEAQIQVGDAWKVLA